MVIEIGFMLTTVMVLVPVIGTFRTVRLDEATVGTDNEHTKHFGTRCCLKMSVARRSFRTLVFHWSISAMMN